MFDHPSIFDTEQSEHLKELMSKHVPLNQSQIEIPKHQNGGTFSENTLSLWHNFLHFLQNFAFTFLKSQNLFFGVCNVSFRFFP